MDYKVSENSDLFVHGIFTNFKDYGQKYEYDIGGGGSSFHNSLRRPPYRSRPHVCHDGAAAPRHRLCSF